MKIHWWCRIFGHKFIGQVESDFLSQTYARLSYCKNCGLSKEEIKAEDLRE